MATYAKSTDVSPERSRDEIIATLQRYGCIKFGFMVDGERGVSVVQFEFKNRPVRLSLQKPTEANDQMKQRAIETRRSRKPADMLEQTHRQRWRALSLYVKAICEAIEEQIVTVDQAFLPFIVLPNNQTVAEWAAPQLAQFALEGKNPPLLPGG
ncbi:MAG: hypothetical protein ABIY70_18255 [Capsulimonas sp.]|uniref:hypothetical protein n=1 Tax=Capsulimonas sp. TaxID=2494211 RepID=UPI00326593CE